MIEKIHPEFFQSRKAKRGFALLRESMACAIDSGGTSLCHVTWRSPGRARSEAHGAAQYWIVLCPVSRHAQ